MVPALPRKEDSSDMQWGIKGSVRGKCLPTQSLKPAKICIFPVIKRNPRNFYGGKFVFKCLGMHEEAKHEVF